VPEFLSADWFALVRQTEVGCDPSLACTVEQLVTGGPTGDVRYRATIRQGRLEIEAGPGPADVRLRLSWSCAVALATGERTAHDAFQRGEVRCSGDLSALQRFTSAIATAGEALSRLRAQTTYTGGLRTPADAATLGDPTGR
jgi:hypothetical protein